jgi:HTH-type transcriptional regulator / antitoxin HigA
MLDGGQFPPYTSTLGFHSDKLLAEIFQEFADDNDTEALLASLRIIARVQGISDVAEQIGMTRQGVQKALSDDGNPRLGNVTSIMKAMGYCLVPQKLPRSPQAS